MFSRNKDSEASNTQAAATPTPRKASGRSAPSLISADVVVNGNLTSGGDIQVDGTIEGDIRSVSLTIGEKASIQGEIIADDVIVRGRVLGSIRARRVQLASSCHVEGNILHEALAVETGAFFEGACRHSADPMSDDSKPSGGAKSARESIFSPSSGRGDAKKPAPSGGKSGIMGGSPQPADAGKSDK